jgi:hypothetical protein
VPSQPLQVQVATGAHLPLSTTNVEVGDPSQERSMAGMCADADAQENKYLDTQIGAKHVTC